MTQKIAITGAGGFLGWHMRAFLQTQPDFSVTSLDRTEFNNPQTLSDSLKGADIVLHFAGVNRGTDQEVADGNPALASILTKALDALGTTPKVLFSSSIQEERDNIYGRSKLQARDILTAWAEQSGGSFVNLIVPHIFGEGGRPNYNSVVSTFCNVVAEGGVPEIANDGLIEPIHAQRLCEKIMEIAQDTSKVSGGVRIHGTEMRVSEMLARLTLMAETYRGNVIPDLRDEFNLDLFNTYRSYLYPQLYPCALTKHSDDRGWLVETVRELNGGQVFFSTTKPGITRGNHFHRHKVERFLVVSGEADIKIRKVGSDHVETFSVSGDEPAFVDIPTLQTHSITNTGAGELLTLFWVHEIFDPNEPDTYAQDVLQGAAN